MLNNLDCNIEGIRREGNLAARHFRVSEKAFQRCFAVSGFRKIRFKDVLLFPTFGKYVSKMFCRFRISESTFQRCFAVSETQKQLLQKNNLISNIYFSINQLIFTVK